MKLDASGKPIKKLTYSTNHIKARYNSQSAHSLVFAQNGDYIIGGERYLDPWVMRLDTSGNIKWATWYHDSLIDQSLFSRLCKINTIRETSRGTIVCAAGDEFPNNGGSPLDNYAAYLEFDSNGKKLREQEWDDPLGYTIAGFDIEETKDGDYLLAGNQAVFYLDSDGVDKWQHSYGFDLEGVGSVTNKITRAKKLRDGTLMVAGQAYEGRCWTDYQKYYWDAWWSPILVSGGHTAWDTAGRQGGDDAIYDFTQLVNGNLVFVGDRHDYDSLSGGIWAFVTDSIGKNVLWETKLRIKYKTDDGRALTPMSVCATPDTGFTIVGTDLCTEENGNYNAFAVHYVPKPPVSIIKGFTQRESQKNVRVTVVGTKVFFPLNKGEIIHGLTIFDVTGKMVANIAGAGTKDTGTLRWDCSSSGRGVYLYRLNHKDGLLTGKVIIP
jgi:hypothetical protein